MEDVTGVVPTRRMSVARGAVRLARVPTERELGAAAAAGNLAAKDAARLHPHVVPAQLTHVECDLAQENGQVVATVTVQAVARTTLSAYALAGASAALVSLAGDEGRIHDLHVVQNVEE
jgi:molybdenum cofactor biosynthesis enzyme